MSEIKWVFLDVGSTLVDESDVYESRCGYVISAKGLERDEFMEKVHQAAKVSPTPIKQAAQAYGVTLPEWDSSLEKLYLGTEDVLKALSGKYKLGIIANQLAGTKKRLHSWGVLHYFDVITASAEAGYEKPDLRIFRLALEQAGCNPQNAIMVGDRLENDIVPARQLGMKMIWVRQGFAKYQSVEKECEKPDYIIENIGEIVKVLMGRT